MTESDKKEQAIYLHSLLHFNYFVSPLYERKLLRVIPINDDSYEGTRTEFEPKPDLLINWLNQNSLAMLGQAYDGAYHSDPTYLLSTSTGLLAVDTFQRRLRREEIPPEKRKDYHYQNFVRVRSQTLKDELPWEITNTFRKLGYEEKHPTDEFQKRWPPHYLNSQ